MGTFALMERSRALAPALFAGMVILACGSRSVQADETPWQKPGADEVTVARDSTECRQAAQKEALRRYPYGAGSPSLGATGAVLSEQRDDNSRAVAETSQFNICMQTRGYHRAPGAR